MAPRPPIKRRGPRQETADLRPIRSVGARGLAKALPLVSNACLDSSKQGTRSMAIRIKARGGESVEQMLRRFKKLCEKEGLTKEIKRRQYFEKPSERRRRAMRKSIQRAIRAKENERR